MTEESTSDRTVVHSMDDLRARASYTADDDVADWIWAASGIDMDVEVEDFGDELNVIVGATVGVVLRYPFTLDELWSAVGDAEDDVMGMDADA